MIRFLIRTAIFFALTAIVTELFFRTVIPACEYPHMKTEDEFILKVYDSSFEKKGIYARGNFDQGRAAWSINNDGWLSDIDYLSPEQRSKPCITIIGDSFVEALLVDWNEHFATRMQRQLDNRYDVYALGMGGSSLGPYINMARYAAKHYDPDVLIFVYTGRDLKAAVANYSRDPSEMQVRYTGNGFEEVAPRKYHASKFRRLARESSIVRYLVWNRNIDLFGGGQRVAAQPDEELPVDIRSERDKERQHILEMAADYMISKLRNENPNRKILFVSDANRQGIYEGETQFPKSANQILIEEACARYDCYTLDLTEAFLTDWQKHKRKFNYDVDYHWNGYAHKIVAQAITDFMIENDIVTSN